MQTHRDTPLIPASKTSPGICQCKFPIPFSTRNSYPGTPGTRVVRLGLGHVALSHVEKPYYY
eukprot:2112196-Rhodomonas_salina.1